MSHFEETSSLEIFYLQRKGDTLVISPKGDAVGFSSTLFQKDQERLMTLLEDPQLDHLIVDFGNAKYFGSEMIGAVNQMIVKVRDSGGETGVCNLSVDMKEGIHVMQLDQLWTIYDSKKEAVKAIVSEPMSQKIEHQIEANRSRLFVLGVVTLIIAIVCVSLFISAKNLNRKQYHTLMTVWNSLEQHQSTSSSSAKTRLVAREGMSKVLPIVEHLENKGSKRLSGEQNLLLAGKSLEQLLADMLPIEDNYFKKKKQKEAKKIRDNKKKNDDSPNPPPKKKTPEESKTEFKTAMQDAHRQFGWDKDKK